MWQMLMWKLIFFGVKMVLNVGNDFLDKTVAEVKTASELKHKDGSDFSGTEKYEFVLTTMLGFAKAYNWGEKERSVVNTVIELAVGYVKDVVPKA